jgi:ribosomal protein L29
MSELTKEDVERHLEVCSGSSKGPWVIPSHVLASLCRDWLAMAEEISILHPQEGGPLTCSTAYCNCEAKDIEIARLEADNASLQREFERGAAQSERFRQACVETQTENKTLKTRVEELEDANEGLQRELAGVEQGDLAPNAELSELGRAELIAKVRDLQRELAEERARLNEVIVALKQRIRSVRGCT